MSRTLICRFLFLRVELGADTIFVIGVTID